MRLPTRPRPIAPTEMRRNADVQSIVLGILVALFSFLMVFLLRAIA